jgi:hypothetical protein
MTQTIAEQALTRVLFYLASCGLELTNDVCIQALQLVQEALTTNPEQPMSGVMDQLQKHFELPAVELAQAVPPINRGSIGYDIF